MRPISGYPYPKIFVGVNSLQIDTLIMERTFVKTLAKRHLLSLPNASKELCSMACIIVRTEYFQEVKGLTKNNYIYACALDQMKTCLYTKIGAVVSEIRIFNEEEEESVKIMFTCISYLV